MLLISTNDIFTFEKKINESLDIINKWCDYTELKLNLEKTIVDSFSSKLVLWRLLDTGPFKNFLFKINKTEDQYCRYCNLKIENFQHFYYHFEKFLNLKSVYSFEKFCNHVIKTWYKDEYML